MRYFITGGSDSSFRLPGRSPFQPKPGKLHKLNESNGQAKSKCGQGSGNSKEFMHNNLALLRREAFCKRCFKGGKYR